jgi:hypothetical protein
LHRCLKERSVQVGRSDPKLPDNRKDGRSLHSTSTPPASRLEGEGEADARFVQLRSQASSNRWVGTSVQFINESADLLELFNFFRDKTCVLKKRISDPQIFRTSEVLIQV